MSINILLTGFEPFGGESINPSWEVAQRLGGELAPGVRVHSRRLPCAFGPAVAALDAALRETRPAVALALGLARGRHELSLERVAVNLIDARIPDNAGAQPIDEPVTVGGPDGYFSTLPLKPMVAGLRAAGHPAGLSYTAGSYVCNAVFYALQHGLAGQGAKSGFMHLPCLPEQAAREPAPSMALAQMIDGVRLALVLALETDASADAVRFSAGTIA